MMCCCHMVFVTLAANYSRDVLSLVFNALKGAHLCWRGSPAMRGTFADALRQATRSSLLSNPSNSTGSRVSSELATTCNRSMHFTAAAELH